MPSRDTVVGLLILGLIATGIFWTRMRPQTESTELPRSATTTPGGAMSSPHDVAAAEATMPDVTTADGVVEVGEVRILLSLSPRPPVAFSPKRFRVRVSHGAAPGVDADDAATRVLPLDEGRISFEMTMPMGDHRYRLVPVADGWYEADVVLPFCQSGNPRWYATVEGIVDGHPVSARFRLDLSKP